MKVIKILTICIIFSFLYVANALSNVTDITANTKKSEFGWSYDTVYEKEITGFVIYNQDNVPIIENIPPNARVASTTITLTDTCQSFYIVAVNVDTNEQSGVSNIVTTFCPERKPLVGTGAFTITFE